MRFIKLKLGAAAIGVASLITACQPAPPSWCGHWCPTTTTTTTTMPPTTTTSTVPVTTTTVPPTTTTVPATTTTTVPPTTTTTTTVPTGQMAPPSGYTAGNKIMEDQFSSLSQWNAFYGPGTRWDDLGRLPSPYSGGNNPNNDSLAYYGPGQCTTGPNGVTLTAKQDSTFSSLGYSWASCTLTSKTALPSGGWYVQIKAEMPDTSQGMWPALWFLPASSAQEFDGHEGGATGSGLPINQAGHSGLFTGGGDTQAFWNTGVDMSTSYNVYGYKYSPANNEVQSYFNGKLVFTATGVSPEAYYIFLQLEVAGPAFSGWHTAATSSTPTSSMKVSEVQAYNGG